jgi:PAS domain S-box-containing protein
VLQGIVDSAMDAIISIDESHRIIVFNEAAEQMFGYAAADILGEPLDRLIPAAFRDVHSSHIAQFAATGTTRRSMRSPGTLMALRAGGQEFPIEAAISQVTLPTGRAFTAIVRDISVRKDAEEKLRLSEEKFAKAFANNPAAVAITRVEDGVFLDVNDTWVELVGYSREEAIGNSARAMNIWPNTQSRLRFTDEIRKHGVLRDWEQQFLKKSGEPFLAQLSAQLLKMDDVDVVVSALVDITARKNAEKNLAEKARLLDLSSDAIIVRDSADRIIYWNRGALHLYGFTAEEALGHLPHDLLQTEFPVSSADALERLRRDGYWTGELTHTVKDGREVMVLSRWSLNREDHGDGFTVLETNRDITEWKQAQKALVRSEKLASAGRMAATVSHEINNPLAIITNSVYLASLDPNLSEESRKHLATAEQELERVAQLTRQTLGFYRENTSPEDVDLGALANSLVAIYRPKLIDRKIEVRVENRCTQSVRAVTGEIRQVLSNLLANAIDACAPGDRILVRTNAVRRGATTTCTVTVADTGEGIARENMKHIFEPFFTTKRSVGTGLGLWLSKQIVERHGGRLRLRRVPSGGTVFTVFLPQTAKQEGKD